MTSACEKDGKTPSRGEGVGSSAIFLCPPQELLSEMLPCIVPPYNEMGVLGQLFGLAHGGEVEGVKYDSLDRFILYTSPVEIRCTLLGLIRTNLCASWAHNWSVGARIVAVCSGV